MHPVSPQPLKVNSAANKSWLINYVESVLPRHIINGLTSTQAVPGENAHTFTNADTHTCKATHRKLYVATYMKSNMDTQTRPPCHELGFQQ